MKTFKQIYESKNQPQNKFVRYGRLDKWAKQKNHVGNKKTDLDGNASSEITFHTAPTGRGFYAMPYKYEESFLIGSLDKTQPDLFPPIECDEEFKNVTYNPWREDNSEYERACASQKAKEKKIYSKNRKIFTLKNTDLIWHHLAIYTPNNEIEKRSGDWVLTTVKAYNKAVKKYFKYLRGFRETWDGNNDVMKYYKSSITNSDFDCLEIFISPT